MPRSVLPSSKPLLPFAHPDTWSTMSQRESDDSFMYSVLPGAALSWRLHSWPTSPFPPFPLSPTLSPFGESCPPRCQTPRALSRAHPTVGLADLWAALAHSLSFFLKCWCLWLLRCCTLLSMTIPAPLPALLLVAFTDWDVFPLFCTFPLPVSPPLWL